MKTRGSLKYFVSYCLWKRFFYSNLFQTPPNLISLTILTILVTLKPKAYYFSLKLEKLSGKNVLKFALLGNFISNLFPDVKTWYQKLFKFALGRFFRKMNFILGYI